MTEWLNHLRESLKAEFADRPAVMILATLSRNGAPRARSVVCRGVDDSGTLWIVSDARSRKNGQIGHDRRVEAVFWLPALRRQFRLRGDARIVGSADSRAREMWEKLPSATRAMFTWPAPGEERVEPDQAFRESLDSSMSPPEAFEIIAIHPRLVEQLDLQEHPHRRRQWKRKNGWRETQINP